MIFERLTWIGFMIVAAGWALLLSAPQLADGIAHLAGRSSESAALNISAIAQCGIVSGFGVGIIGALQTGFGALNKFFEAVLARSQQSRTHAATPSLAPTQAAARAAVEPLRQPAPRNVARAPAQSRKIQERGWVKDRAYLLFTDGSVEVETMLGRRKFPSLQEAQEFIA
jgi:hypothetical protein